MGKAVELVLGGTLKILAREVDQPQAGCFVTLTFDTFTVTARGDDMAYTLPVDRQIRVAVKYVDAHGNPAAVDGPVAWASSNVAIVDVIPVVDGTEATVRAISIGQAQVTATADADLGEGVRELVTTMDVTVVAGEAVAGVIEPVGESSPIPQPKR